MSGRPHAHGVLPPPPTRNMVAAAISPTISRMALHVHKESANTSHRTVRRIRGRSYWYRYPYRYRLSSRSSIAVRCRPLQNSAVGFAPSVWASVPLGLCGFGPVWLWACACVPLGFWVSGPPPDHGLSAHRVRIMAIKIDRPVSRAFKKRTTWRCKISDLQKLRSCASKSTHDR